MRFYIVRSSVELRTDRVAYFDHSAPSDIAYGPGAREVTMELELQIEDDPNEVLEAIRMLGEGVGPPSVLPPVPEQTYADPRYVERQRNFSHDVASLKHRITVLQAENQACKALNEDLRKQIATISKIQEQRDEAIEHLKSVEKSLMSAVATRTDPAHAAELAETAVRDWARGLVEAPSFTQGEMMELVDTFRDMLVFFEAAQFVDTRAPKDVEDAENDSSEAPGGLF